MKAEIRSFQNRTKDVTSGNDVTKRTWEFSTLHELHEKANGLLRQAMLNERYKRWTKVWCFVVVLCCVCVLHILFNCTIFGFVVRSVPMVPRQISNKLVRYEIISVESHENTIKAFPLHRTKMDVFF